MIPNPTDFDEILDGCLLEVTAGRSSVEDCLSRYPQVAAQLEPLLRSAARVYALPRPSGLAAEKRRAIEQQLLSRAAQSKAPATPRWPIASARRSFGLRFGLVVLVAVLMLVGGAGVMTASTASLPDDLLYPVKRLAEQVSLATASSSAQASLHVDLAQRRMDEFEALATRDDIRPELMTEASTEIEIAMQTAATLPGDQQQPMLTTVIRLADTHAALIASTSARASAATRASLNVSATTASAARERALRLADSLPPDTSTTVVPPGTGPTTSTSTSTSTPTGTPGVTATSTVVAPIGPGTLVPTLPAVKPTDKPTNTPRPPNTPPGQVKTPNTPPGQVKTPKPDNDPPGQADKTPKPKK